MQLDDDINPEWQTLQGSLALLERLNQLESQFYPLKGAIRDVVIPMADKLAIRCLLDVFLYQQGYSPQVCGSRRAWVADNKTNISQVTGIAEGDVEKLFQCASLLIPFPSFFLIALTPEHTEMRAMQAFMCSGRTPLRML